jgi:hypothetical protein
MQRASPLTLFCADEAVYNVCMYVCVCVVCRVGVYFRGTESEIKHMFRNSHIVWSNKQHTKRIKLDFQFY